MKTEWGVPRLLSLDIFNDISKGYLVDDCCVFGVEVFVLNHTGRMECMSMVKNPANNIYTLEIDNFSSLNKAFYYSDVFTIQGVRWWLFYYPRGYLKAKEGLSVFLCNVEKQKVYAEFKLRVKNQVDAKGNVEVAVRYWFPGSPLKMIGPDCIISLKDLNDISKGYILENDTLILEAEIMVTSETKNLS